MILGSGARVG